MRLVSLTLQGFKSFADRTTLEFTEPVTAIVGPNGSGKSNLIDALRWASGGGRSSEFRAGDKRELIFHGAAGKRSLGFAEVSLGLEHGGRSLAVSRTLTRDGDTQLRVGGRAARFLDLEDELSGSGLGRGGLAVIGQGEVGGVLMADPPKLLAYVAESVGVAKLAARREGTLASLAQAEAHLTRLEDVRLELEARVAALAAEAAGAERAGALERERLCLRYTLSLRRVEGLSAELSGLRESGARLEARLLEGREALTDAQAERRAAKTALEEAEARYRQFTADAEAKKGDARVAAERHRAAEVQRAVLARDAARLGDELRALDGLAQPEPLDGDEAAHREALASARTRVADIAGVLSAHRAEVAARGRALEGARRAAAEAAQARTRYAANRDGLLRQLGEVETQRSALSVVDTQDAEADLGAAETALAARKRDLETARAALADLQRAHAAAVAEAQARTGAAERGRAAFAARRGYAQGPKSALTSGIDGVIGSVADLITVPPEYARAVGGALGRRAEHVVVESSGVAQAVLAHVRRAGGWVTLLPLDLMQNRVQTLPAALAAEGSVVRLASDVVESEPRFRALVQGLLSGTALVTALPEAVALARRHRVRPRFVTLEGDVLEAYGAISGGRAGGAGLVLGAAADLKAAEEAAATARAEAEARTRTLAAGQQGFRAGQEALTQAEDLRSSAARTLATARERAAAQASLEAELVRREGQLREALAALTAPVGADAPDPAPLEAALSAAQAEDEALRTALAAAQEDVAAAQGALAVWLERARAYAAAAARYAAGRARAEGLRLQLGELGTATAEAESGWQAAVTALQAAEAALPTGDADERGRLGAARQAEADADGRLEALSRTQAALAGELEALHLSLARREAAFELAGEEHRAFPAGLEALPGGPKALRDRLGAVEAELAELGPVNHRAAGEHGAQRSRLADLTHQLDDARNAAAELVSVLDGLDAAVRERLVAGTAALGRSFAGYAERLFGAGAQASADLVWEEGRPVGLKLALQPPAKQTRALSLLSVGERTMGALAFLFALMAAEGTPGLPLAILDEVDAPLDEANIRRFCSFLGELSGRGTQFVLITHQKATMEVAGALWGVTTQAGVSRVFSIRREAEAAGGGATVA